MIIVRSALRSSLVGRGDRALVLGICSLKCAEMSVVVSRMVTGLNYSQDEAEKPVPPMEV